MLRGDANNSICGQLWFTQNGQIGHLDFVSSRSQFFEQMFIESLEKANMTTFKNISKQFLTLSSMGAGFTKLSFGHEDIHFGRHLCMVSLAWKDGWRFYTGISIVFLLFLWM